MDNEVWAFVIIFYLKMYIHKTSLLFCWFFFVCWGAHWFLVFFLFFQDMVSLCSPSCPGIHSVDQTGFKRRDLPASARPPSTWVKDIHYYARLWLSFLKLAFTRPIIILFLLQGHFEILKIIHLLYGF